MPAPSDIVEWALAQPLRTAAFEAPNRIVDDRARFVSAPEGEAPSPGTLAHLEVNGIDASSREGEALVARAAELARGGAAGFWLSGPNDRDRVLAIAMPGIRSQCTRPAGERSCASSYP